MGLSQIGIMATTMYMAHIVCTIPLVAISIVALRNPLTTGHLHSHLFRKFWPAR